MPNKFFNVNLQSVFQLLFAHQNGFAYNITCVNDHMPSALSSLHAAATCLAAVCFSL